jgi:hypothetical protein
MRTSWSPLAWAKSVVKEQEAPKPKAIPEDSICLDEYGDQAFICASSRTENTDIDPSSPYSSKLATSTSFCVNDNNASGAWTSRTDDTDDGSPCTKRRLTRCSTKDLVAMVDQRTQEVEQLLAVGSALITEQPPQNGDLNLNSCHTTPTHRFNTGRTGSCRWENLHDEADAYLKDIQDRLVSMSGESADPDEDEAEQWHDIEEGELVGQTQESDLVGEVRELRQIVEKLVKDLAVAKESEAAMNDEIVVL